MIQSIEVIFPEPGASCIVVFPTPGPQGEAGPQGETGPQGPAGSDANVTTANVGAALAAAAAKAAPVDADGVAIIDSEAGAPKLLSFASLGTWIKSKLDAVLTIAGAKTFSGQMELTGQAATNPTSAMTREIGDGRYFHRTVAVKTSNTARVSTTVLADDPDLKLFLEPGTYILETQIVFFTVTGQTHGFKGATMFSGTKTWFEGCFSNGNTGASQAVLSYPDHYSSTYPFFVQNGTTVAAGSSHARGVIVVTASGWISIQWAQNTSSASPTTVGRGSYLLATKIL